MTRFYLVKDRKRSGPFSIEELAANGLERTSLVWRQGMSTWMRADLLPELAELIVTIPPPLPGSGAAEASQVEGDLPPPGVFQGLFVAFNILFLSGMLAAVIATVGYLRWLDAKADMMHGSIWQAFLHDPLKVNVPMNPSLDILRYSQAAQRLNQASVMVWTSGIIAGVLLVPAAILFAVFLAASWSLVQDEKAPTPAAAAGLLFVPLFNFFWIFIALSELALTLNRAVREEEGAGPSVSWGLALVCCILFIGLFIPFLSALLVVPATVVFILVMYQIKKASVFLTRAKSAT